MNFSPKSDFQPGKFANINSRLLFESLIEIQTVKQSHPDLLSEFMFLTVAFEFSADQAECSNGFVLIRHKAVLPDLEFHHSINQLSSCHHDAADCHTPNTQDVENPTWDKTPHLND